MGDVTPAVERAIRLGQALAHGANAATVRPLDLLHGLLAEEEGRAAQRAIAAGLAWSDYSQTVAIPPTHALEVPLSDATLALLRDARGLAIDYSGEKTIVGDVLLLALVRGDAEVRARLESFGFHPSQYEADLESTRPPVLDLDEPLSLVTTTEQIDLGRVIDAAANRAREGLRVVEDYCRFVLDDAFLCRELKQLRHDLAAVLAEFPPELLLPARETQRDVGVAITTESEQRRYSLRDTARVNFRRVEESFRSLEEYSKLHSAGTGTAVEQLRYRAYTLERALWLGADAKERLANTRLCVLLGAGQCDRPLDWIVREALTGGADMIQLREKDCDDRTLVDRARTMRSLTRAAGAIFIVNDRPDIARLVDADGVHLGQDDLPVKEARRIVGPSALIGVSTHNVEQVRQAVRDGASYLGVGPTFPSGTKEFTALAGLEFVRAALAETSLPAFVIGGVNLATISDAVAAGARRVAVSGAIARSEDPRSVATQLRFSLTADMSSER